MRRGAKVSSRGFLASRGGFLFGKVSLVVLFLFVALLFVQPERASATAGTLTISIPNSIPLNIVPSAEGTFASSSGTISVSTTFASGYTLGIKASSANNNALISTTDNTKTISSITTPISEATFSGSSTYNDKWGYKPSKLNSAANPNYLEAPTSTTITTLDQTNVANGTANTYTIGIGARLSTATAPGTYENTFVFTVIANPTPYTITYNANDGASGADTTNMPTPNPNSSSTYADTVTLSNTVPVRDGYNFKGWCTVQTSDGADTTTCTSASGTTYNPDGGGTGLAWTVDQTASSNSLSLYAMWASAAPGECTDTATCMQTMSTCPTTATTVTDARDGNTYKVQKLADNNCWMLDNLRLDPTAVSLSALQGNTNASNTTLSYLKNGGGSGQYPASGVSSAWTSSSQNSYTLPYINAASKDTTVTSYGAGSGKVGVYYNYCAASAGSYCYASGSGTGNATEDLCPAGWRMPTGGDNDSSNEYYNLGTALGLTYDEDEWAFTGTAYQTALSTPLSGNFYGGSADGQGGYGLFWSSTVSNGYSMYDLDVDSDRADPTGASLRYSGYSMRCIKEPLVTLYDEVASAWEAEGSRVLTNDTDTSTGIQAAITTSNSGVFKYNPSTFGASSDAANTSDIYFYRGILDTTVGSYGSDGDNEAHPNTVVLSSASEKSSLTTSDTCWRIVRTTGSGGVKMIYQGKWTGSTCANASTNAQNPTFGLQGNSAQSTFWYYNINRVGYTFNNTQSLQDSTTSTSVDTVFGSDSSPTTNNARSNIKTYIEDTWYSGAIGASSGHDYTSKLEASAGYCNDRTAYSDTTTSTALTEIMPYATSSAAMYFGAYGRNVNATNAGKTPSLNCPRSTVDLYRYVTSSATEYTSNELKYPAALLTADEASFAGSGRRTATEGSAYHANSYLRSRSDFWLLSPYYRASNGSAQGFYLNSFGNLGYTLVSYTNGVRPAISLASGTSAASGSGTATDPWIVNP